MIGYVTNKIGFGPVAEIFATPTLAALIAVFVAEPMRVFYQRELVQAVDGSLYLVQRELKRMERAGLVVRSVRGRHVEYRATRENPLLGGLKDVLAHTSVFGSELSGAANDSSFEEPSPERFNPVVRPHITAIAAACRRHGAVMAALVGSATQADQSVIPRDIDVLVSFGPEPEGRAEQYFGLLEELERIMGMPVEVIEEDALENSYLKEEFRSTQVVLYAAA